MTMGARARSKEGAEEFRAKGIGRVFGATRTGVVCLDRGGGEAWFKKCLLGFLLLFQVVND